jgi:hypothetical protein
MASVKTYTLIENIHGSSSRQHRLVRAAYNKGLTSVFIFHYPNGQPGGGWCLCCDQIKKLNIGFTIDEAENRINQIDATIITKA